VLEYLLPLVEEEEEEEEEGGEGEEVCCCHQMSQHLVTDSLVVEVEVEVVDRTTQM